MGEDFIRGGGQASTHQQERHRIQKAAQLIELGLGFVAMTAGVFLLYALAAGWLRSRVLGSERAMAWLRRAFAASLAGLGAKLAFERA